MTISGLSTGATEVSADGWHTCALAIGGGIKCWGDNDFGQLGNGTTTFSWTLLDVVDLSTGVAGIGTGRDHTCAVTVGGDVKCWGDNSRGQLGDGTTTNRLTPVDVVLGLAYDCTAVTEIPRAECAALVALYKEVNGPLWQTRAGWLQTLTPCSWWGVTCQSGHVTQLNLSNNNLADALPMELGDLTALEQLDLSGNDINGLLSVTLGNLKALRILNLAHNRLSGSIPLTMGNLVALQTLDLHSNAFSGSIPPQLGSLYALRHLDLSENTLDRWMSVNLSNLTVLQYLNLSHNQLENLWDWGEYYDAGIGNLTVLQHLDLSYNHMTEELPRWPGFTVLRYLDLSHNDFVGALPPEMGKLTALTYLGLHTNHLSGTIPPELGMIGSAAVTTTLTAPFQQQETPEILTEKEDDEIGPLSRPDSPNGPPPGVYIDLSCNHLIGTIPGELGRIARLQGLELSGNQLSGPIPAELINPPLYYRNLHYNLLRAPALYSDLATQTVPPTGLRATTTSAAANAELDADLVHG